MRNQATDNALAILCYTITIYVDYLTVKQSNNLICDNHVRSYYLLLIVTKLLLTVKLNI